jgi:hypothetical protein
VFEKHAQRQLEAKCHLYLPVQRDGLKEFKAAIKAYPGCLKRLVPC